jgi:hypothetical protein
MPRDLNFYGGYIEIRLREKNHLRTPHCHVHFNDGTELWISLGGNKRTIKGNAKRKNISVALELVEQYEEELLVIWEERHG